MKIFKLVLAVALTLTSAIASAENIYREGTKGHELATYAQTVLPDSVTPYFVMAKDKGYFLGQVDQAKRTKVLSDESLKTLQGLAVDVHRRAVAFAKYETVIPEGANRNVCRVVFVDSSRAVIGSTLMHELMHCRIGSAELNPEYRRQFMKAVGMAEGIDPGAALTMFEEILARAMSLSYIVNYGIEEDGAFFKERLSKSYPANPGPHSMPRVLRICLKEDACSVEAGSLAKTLLSDGEFRVALQKDFQSNHAHDVAVGF